MRRHLYPPPPTLWFEQWEPQSVPNVFQSEVKVDIYQSKGLNNTTEGLDICCNISQMKYPPELIRNLKFANIWYCLPFASTWVHPWFFVWVRIAHLFNFLCCGCFCFVSLRPVSCLPNVSSVSVLTILGCPMFPVSLYWHFTFAQCFQCLCIDHFWLPNVSSVSVLTILVCPMFPVSLYWPFMVAPLVFSNVCLKQEHILNLLI